MSIEVKSLPNECVDLLQQIKRKFVEDDYYTKDSQGKTYFADSGIYYVNLDVTSRLLELTVRAKDGDKFSTLASVYYVKLNSKWILNPSLNSNSTLLDRDAQELILLIGLGL